MTDGAAAYAALRRAAHDLRGSLGSIRFAVGAVIDNEPVDAEFTRSMLAGVDAEISRMVATVTALPELVSDGSPAAPVVLGDVLSAAAARVAHDGLVVEVDAAAAVTVPVPGDPVAAVAAVLAIAAGDASAVRATVDLARAAIRLEAGARSPAADALLERLAEAMGAQVSSAPGEVVVWWPQ